MPEKIPAKAVAEVGVVKRTPGLACVGVIVALGAALPVFADGGLTPFASGNAGAGVADPGAGFLKIAPSAGSGVTGQARPYRFDTSLLSATEPYASVKPWLGTERTASRNTFGVAGILVDVPLGNFIFTPSFGGGRYTESDGRDQTSALQFRSSLALGYRFDDQSRFSIDYSHTSATAQTLGGPVGGNALSFTYRIPSTRLPTWLLGQ